MGSNFGYVPIDKAAEFLGLSKRSVYSYIKKGSLRTKKHNKGTLVLREDVVTLKELRDRKDLPYPVNKLTIARLDARVQMLEQQMDVVMRMLDLRAEPLGLSPAHLEALYTMAQHHVDQQWSPHDEEVWVDTFVRISIDDFEAMEDRVYDDHPWRPFYQLCKAMLNAPCDVDNKLQLNAGKANLERIAHVWTVSKGLHDKELTKIVEKDDKAVRKVVRKRKPKNKE